jgi:hypothetical protein
LGFLTLLAGRFTHDSRYAVSLVLLLGGRGDANAA